jgi:hypothetical protein
VPVAGWPRQSSSNESERASTLGLEDDLCDELIVGALDDDHSRHARHAIDFVARPQLSCRADDDLANGADDFVAAEFVTGATPVAVELPPLLGNFVEAGFLEFESTTGFVR